VVTVYVPATPMLNPAVIELVIPGAVAFVSVKACVTVPLRFLAVIVMG
jgi:hypothetical protein